MRHIRFVCCALLTILISSSCEEQKRAKILFYPVDSVLNDQVAQLTAAHATLQKTARIGDERSSVDLHPDSLAWTKELEIFYHLESINKPVNEDVYRVTDSTDASGMNIRTFRATEDAPVMSLKIHYQNKPVLPLKLEARVRESNSMFEGNRDLSMEFSESNGKAILTKYTITGGQEMFVGDSVQYQITGIIRGGS